MAASSWQRALGGEPGCGSGGGVAGEVLVADAERAKACGHPAPMLPARGRAAIVRTGMGSSTIVARRQRHRRRGRRAGSQGVCRPATDEVWRGRLGRLLARPAEGARCSRQSMYDPPVSGNCQETMQCLPSYAGHGGATNTRVHRHDTVQTQPN